MPGYAFTCHGSRSSSIKSGKNIISKIESLMLRVQLFSSGLVAVY